MSVQQSFPGPGGIARIARTSGATGDAFVITTTSLQLLDIERLICLATLHQEGTIMNAAKVLGITRHALFRRIKKHEIEWPPKPITAVGGDSP